MARKVKEASQACRATPMQFYLAAMQVLLARLADVDDVCIGVTDSGRTAGFEDAIGHFTNMLPMRFRIDKKQPLRQLIEETSDTVLGAFDHGHVPFDVLLELLDIKIERSLAHTPLFQTAFNYRVGSILQMPLGNCTMIMDKYLDMKTPYDLTINVTPTGNQGHLLECITNSDLYSASASEFILDAFVGLVDSLTRDQSFRVQDCRLFNEAQSRRAVALGRGPTIRHAWPQSLSERFEQVRSAFPASLAIKDAHESLTYDQLGRRVDLCAAQLLKASIRSGSRVAVLCEPSIDVYATMLAILQIGAIYVPLEVSLPTARHRSMMSACRPEVLVFHAATATAAAGLEGGDEIRLLNLSTLKDSRRRVSFPPFTPSPAAKDSFILFTSGSTGTPKGIRLSQRDVMNYAASKSTMLGLGRVKVLQQTSTGFDMAIAQALNAFCNGGTLVVAPCKARGDPAAISKLMLDEAIEFTLCTPSEYLMLATYAVDCLRRCTSWRYACSGGEVVSQRLIKALRRLEISNLTLTDCYGPTELSCATAFRRIPLQADDDGFAGARDGTVSRVGKAIPNTSIYILGDDGRTALPPDIPVEICVGGSGVARGYLDAGLNRGKFVPDPFASREDAARGRGMMYKTGDKGFLQPDGSLTFLGRTDGGETVVKLRGLRIDLAEVANAILEAAPEGTLANAIVTVRGEPQFLVSHVVFSRGKSLGDVQLESILRDLELPQYMIPSVILPLNHVPTTSNGKVDRAALESLPIQERPNKESREGSALSVPEGELRVIWMEVLGEAANAASIGPDSDFFAVGGSSLLLVRLQNAPSERMGAALSLQELYQATVLRKMAAMMHKERGQLVDRAIDWEAETAIPSELLKAARHVPLSPPPQRRRRQVLLTGAGSFLGGEILRQLAADEEVAKIHCIAISDDERPRLPIEVLGKMVVYAGSLMSPTLGLSGTETAFLKSNIDQIIHAAVQGHCMNNYMSVRRALYLSTQTLAGLAVPRRIPLHFVSAPRVVLLSGKPEGGPVSMAHLSPPTDGSQGVTASKWASECFLEKVARETGLPVVVHRHCAMIGERAPADEVMNSVVRFSLLSRKVPRIPGAAAAAGNGRTFVTLAARITWLQGEGHYVTCVYPLGERNSCHSPAFVLAIRVLLAELKEIQSCPSVPIIHSATQRGKGQGP